MTHILAIALAGFLLLAGSSSAVGQDRGAVRVTKEGKELVRYDESCALVIGIDDYSNLPDVEFAESDARYVARKLREMGFSVRELIGDAATKTGIENELLALKNLSRNSRFVFFFAGHGEMEEGKSGPVGHILPCDAESNDNPQFAVSTISMGFIKERVDATKVKHVLILLDCCMSGSILIERSGDLPLDIAKDIAENACYVITAGEKDEKIVDHGRNGHSFFTANLLEALDGRGDLNGDGYLRGTELAKYLSERVVEESHDSQHPQYGKLLDSKGDFVFVLKDIAHLDIRTNVPEIEVFIDGERVGVGDVTDLPVKKGSHTLKLRDPTGQHEDRTMEIVLRGRQDTLIHVSMSKSSGTLIIESNVSDADVFVDNEHIGTTPLRTLRNVGVHGVRVSKPGYYEENKQSKVYPNQETREEFNLRSIRDEYMAKLKRWRNVKYFSMGLTVISGGGSLYFWRQERSDLDKYQTAGPTEVAEYRDRYERNRTYMQICLGTLAAALVLDVYSYAKQKGVERRIEEDDLQLGLKMDGQRVYVTLSKAF